ncbi:MAG: glucose-1-phosphate cytidylyltransferase [Myxococcales bacterium]|nr:glucose-1-phosphate cytidylyltransferase [Myxococcales bacterium]
MKVVIFAGGLGSRLSEETEVKPKPMVEIGGKPILWHIMKHYAHFGVGEFVLTLGYRADIIKRYFLELAELEGSLTLDLAEHKVTRHRRAIEDWRIHLMDTGLSTLTGGRLQASAHLLGDGTFMLTYGDGVADVDIHALLAFHRAHGKLATVTAVRPPARFGGLEFEGDKVTRFTEKPQIGEGWINGGFFVLEPGALAYLAGDTPFEREPLEGLARDGQLMAFRHESFWQCMDTLRDKRLLEGLWSDGKAPWKVWA